MDDWDKRAKTYQQLEWANRQGSIEAIIGEMDLRVSDTVLDAGAGTGPISFAIAPMADCVIALDQSQAMLDRIPFHPDIIREVGDVTNMRFNSGLFDKVVMRQVLHLIDEPVQALRECHRVLRDGGRMVLCEGIPPHLDLQEWFSEMLRAVKDRHVFSIDDLYDLMENAGFSIVKQTIYVEPQVSINNWLVKSRVDSRTRRRALRMHHELCEEGKKYYNMTTTDATRCDFHFLILVGEK